MKLAAVFAFVLAVTFTACKPGESDESLTAAKASAQRIAHLEQKVDLLQRVIASMERSNRRANRGTNAVVATNSVSGEDNEDKHRQYENVMNSLTEDVADLAAQEQSVEQRIEAITQAILALEQAVLALDAEMQQMRGPSQIGR